MKKILVIHNKYREAGGEDIAVENEIKFLKQHFNVQVLFFDNQVKNVVSQFFYFLLNSNIESKKLIQKSLDEFKPDIVYVHNTWFKASLSIFDVLLSENVQILLKLHNFRHFCTSTFFSKRHLMNGDICHACGNTKKDLGWFNRYYSNSFIKSFLVNYYGTKYAKILKNPRIKIIALTNFHKTFLNNLGYEESKIYVIPNTINLNEKNFTQDKKNVLIYAGRISNEKGVEELIRSFNNRSDKTLKLKIIGDGPELGRLKAKYSNEDVEFLGYIDNPSVQKIIMNSKAIVTATKLFEGQPTILCEAAVKEIPTIFPESGGIAEFYPENYELSFKQFSYKELTKKIDLLSDSKKTTEQGKISKNFMLDYLDSEKILSKFNSVLT